MKQKTGRKLLGVLLTLAMVVGLMPGMGLTAYAAPTETLLTTITATAKEQASYSTTNVATVSFSYTAGGSSAYLANWGWWGYGWSATVNAAEGYTITKCVFYDDSNRTATDSEAPFVVETTEEDKTPKVNGTPILEYTSKGIKKIEVYGYVTPAATHSVTITAGDHMTKTADSGEASQTDLTGAMTDVVYTADNGYYYPTDYSVAEVSGIKVTRDSYTQITVSGTPTADDEITLTAPTAKTTPDAPTAAATDCTTADNNDGKLTGVTTAMEYKKSDAADWTAGTGSDITGLVPGTYYVRVKATETTNASTNQELTIKGFISYTVTFKVVNGKWNEGEGDAATADKTVTLTGHDGDTLKLTADQIPAVGTKPNDNYKAGSWDVTPNTTTAITEATTYTYTYAQKESISRTVTFKVVNGKWDDETTADKTVTLTGYEGDTLKLTADQIPAVGSKPSDTYKAGSWDVTPSTETEITADTTYTYTYAQKDSISQTVTFKVVNGSWDDETTADKTVTLTGYEGDTLKLAANQIPAVGTKPNDTYKAGSWDVTPSTETEITAATTYTYTYAQKDGISQTVTFKVVNGSWNDETTADKTVTLTGYEGDTLKLAASQIPTVGTEPNDTYKAGSWDVTPSTETEITADTTYTYTYAQKDSISQTVTFKVVNGSWDDETTADKTVTLTGYEGDTLKLAASQIPTVGTKPNGTYKAGSWDVTPSTETEITADTTYTYTYTQKEAATVTKAPEAKTLTYTGSAQSLVTAGSAEGGEMQYALGTATKATQLYITSIPTATNAGTYYVWYMVKGDGNHSDTEAAYITATISEVVSQTVTFKVVNGSWNDGTTADKTVTLTGAEGDVLMLSADQIPGVGSKPNTNYKAGSWNTTPNTESVISADVTYTYTYAEAEPKEENEEGDVVAEAESGDGAPTCSVENVSEDVYEAVASSEEKNAVENGDTLYLGLRVEKADDNVSGNEQSLAESAAEDVEVTIGMYLDVTLYKWLESDPASKNQITNLHGKCMRFYIDVPGFLHGGDGVRRTFYVFRIHDGAITLIAKTHNTVIAVDSDLFSTYVLAYSDIETDADDDDDEMSEESKRDLEYRKQHPNGQHTYVQKIVQDPTAEVDGVMINVCCYCGWVERDSEMSISGYPVFNAETIEAIGNTSQGSTVTMQTKSWYSVHRNVLEALAKRPDETLVFKFIYDKKRYVLTISGSDPLLELLLESEDDYFGFMYLGSVFSLVEEDWK